MSDDVSGTETKKAGAPTVVFAVPEGKRISVGAPSLIALANGKLLAAFDQTGPDVKGLTGKKGHDAKRNRWMQGRVMANNSGRYIAITKLKSRYQAFGFQKFPMLHPQR